MHGQPEDSLLPRSVSAATPPYAPAWTWLVPRYGAYSSLANSSLGGSPEVVANAFNQGTTWFSVRYKGAGPATANPVPAGYSGIAVLKFEAYQNGSTGLVDAIRAGLPSWVQAVQYDPRAWKHTPDIEKGAWLYNPYAQASYAQLFCRTAHECGLRVILSPGNDLCSRKPNGAYPGGQPQYPVQRGQPNYQAYLQYNLASAARWLSPGDVYVYQAQALELSPARYRSVTAAVAQQVSAVAAGVVFLAGLGRSGQTWDGATYRKLSAAARGVTDVVAGFWPNVDANAPRVEAMIDCLLDLGY